MKVAWSAEDALQERSLGRYNLIASLGQGGMANVYLAVVAGPGSFNKLLVIKALRSDVNAGSEFVQMFLDEARLSARFNHPNIVQTYEVGEANGRYFIAMEYLDGQTLRAVQRKLPGAFPLEEELRVIAETARGLHYAHETRDFAGEPLKVVHRDVSPQNVFLTYDGQVKLLDFGIAKALDSEHLTQVGLIKGKVDYIAPEQARGESVDRRADIFSLGAMAWEAVTRQRFAGSNKIPAVTKLHKRLTGGEPDVLEVQPEAPEKLVNLIRRAVALDPARRFDTAAALATEIEDFLDSMNLRPSATTLAERLARPFMPERAKIGSVIEEELKRLGQVGVRTSSIPSIDRADLTLSRSGIVGTSDEFSASHPNMVASTQSKVPPFRRWLATRNAKIAVVFASITFAVAMGVLGSQPPPRTIEPGATTPTPMATSLPTAPEPRPEVASTIAFDVRVSPGTAKASLDGSQLPKLPFHAALQKDGQLHHVEVSAPGYETKKVLVPFDQDRDLHIVLERMEQAPFVRSRQRSEGRREPRLDSEPASAVVSSPQLPAERPAEAAPGAPLVSKRRAGVRIDKVDPYAE